MAQTLVTLMLNSLGLGVGSHLSEIENIKPRIIQHFGFNDVEIVKSQTTPTFSVKIKVDEREYEIRYTWRKVTTTITKPKVEYVEHPTKLSALEKWLESLIYRVPPKPTTSTEIKVNEVKEDSTYFLITNIEEINE